MSAMMFLCLFHPCAGSIISIITIRTLLVVTSLYELAYPTNMALTKAIDLSQILAIIYSLLTNMLATGVVALKAL
jgi:hypothetical protein